MDYKTIRDKIEDMVNDNHKDFVKAVISMEKGINDESALDKLYDAYIPLRGRVLRIFGNARCEPVS